MNIEVIGDTVIKMYQMKPGEIGRIISSAYFNEIVIAGYETIISLTKPEHSWNVNKNNQPTQDVSLFPQGTKINITI